MRVEDPRYFTQNDLEPHLSLPPDCDWQTMIARQEVLAPAVLVDVLKKAAAFLITQPGPNLDQRKELAPAWFDSWKNIIEINGYPFMAKEYLYTPSNKIMPLEAVAGFLEKENLVSSSGVLFVAGAEGHRGHRHAADHMARYISCPILVFEQDSYLLGKARKAPFLPLPVRLSMWHYYPSPNVVTVAPERPAEMPESQHYLSLFKKLGARYCFAEEKDPYYGEKTGRGDFANFLMIPHYPTVRTTVHVQELMEPIGRSGDEEKFCGLVKALEIGRYLYGWSDSFWEI